jgi:hypothetical protein
MWVVGITFVCLFFGTYGRPSLRSNASNPSGTHVITIDQLPPVPRRKAHRLVGNLVSPSLEMKENVDFLLTPAILVQEAISSGVIPTYPTE